MAGHSHWAGIKHKKAIVDVKRGKIFSKMAKLIMQAARNGADPVYNIRLRHSIDKAKSYNMPNDKIDNAVKKGSGKLEGYTLEEVIYEGYGPGGIAIMIEALTDNRNRTTPEIRHTFEKYKGSMAGPNSVVWKFNAKGLISATGVTLDEDALAELLINAGAEDYTGSGGSYEIQTGLDTFEAVKQVLTDQGITFKADITKVPTMTIPLDADGYRRILRLMEELEDNDDVQEVYADFDVTDEVLAAVDGG